MAHETAQLAQLVRQKLDCLNQIWELGRQQLHLIEASEMSELLELLAAKQQRLALLERIERELDPFREQRPEDRVWSSPEERQRCADGIDRCQALLGEIVTQEKTSEQHLARRRDEAAARLAGAHWSERTRGAYVELERHGGNQLDLSSEQ